MQQLREIYLTTLTNPIIWAKFTMSIALQTYKAMIGIGFDKKGNRPWFHKVSCATRTINMERFVHIVAAGFATLPPEQTKRWKQPMAQPETCNSITTLGICTSLFVAHLGPKSIFWYWTVDTLDHPPDRHQARTLRFGSVDLRHFKGQSTGSEL